jgi:Co/Zn/Cd efflux system component
MRQKALYLEYFTVGWNVLEGLVAIIAGILAASIALVGLGLNALLGWWWADPLAALAMVVFLVREGWEAIEEGWESPK